ERRFAQQAGARLPAQLRDRLGESLVAVHRLQGELGHSMYPLLRSSPSTSLAVLAGSAARGAGFSPAMSRIQATCRASTDTRGAIAAIVGVVRFAPCPM